MAKPQDKLRMERMSDGERAATERALETLPEVPERAVLSALLGTAMNTRSPPGVDLWEVGKSLQAKHDGIPWKTEYEVAAGLWWLVRSEIIAARGETA